MESMAHEQRYPTRRELGVSPSHDAAQPAIEDYGLIGDCRTAALISRHGSVDWLCLPNFDSPSIFARLLDPLAGGCFSIRPRDSFTSKRRYLESTCILETTFETRSGQVRILDLMPIPDDSPGLSAMREVLRIIQGVVGEVDVTITIDPRPGYGRARPRLRGGGRLGWSYFWSNQLLLVHADVALSRADLVLSGSVAVRAGQQHYISLAYVQNDPAVIPGLGGEADARLDRTKSWWRRWSDQCTYTGTHRGAVLRSALTLKALCFTLSGAILAAPTTSLPEAIGGERNWDYRYCWLRDAGLTMRALTGLGFFSEAGAYLDWLVHATGLTWPGLSVLYDVYGRAPPPLYECGHLAGYRGSKPVRIGNAARSQKQLDVYGQVALAAYALLIDGHEIDPVTNRRLPALGRMVLRYWRDGDQGIWEFPGPPRQFTFSKVMCWVALDRLLTLDGKGIIHLGRRRAAFERERESIGQVIETHGFNTELGSYASELGGSRLDAAVLLMGRLGYKDVSDPRMVSTYDRIVKQLVRGELVYRYEHGYDGMESREGTFAICAFWRVDYLARRGQLDEAEHLFERLLGRASDLGLFAEEIDADTGAALGNFPQAFTHIGLINAAIAIKDAREATL
jgi:GH15 family glucan-1,4-alpha-glucosidase